MHKQEALKTPNDDSSGQCYAPVESGKVNLNPSLSIISQKQ